jgi:hypothetical protein
VVQETGTVTIAGNIIGLAANGNDPLPNLGGIILRKSNLNVVGTNSDGLADADERNVISANTDVAIEMDAVSNTIIAGNSIGTRADGSGNRGNGSGIVILEGNVNGASYQNTIGGTFSVSGNIIAHNLNSGVVIRGDDGAKGVPTRNAILSNSIFDNGGLGIDLVPMPVSVAINPNDPADADFGPNNTMNHPEIISAVNNGGVTRVRVQITNGLPSTVIRVQFFSSPNCDNQGVGEGQVYLEIIVAAETDASGNDSFEIAMPIQVPTGDVVTTTATDPDGNTSEFSPCVTVTNN